MAALSVIARVLAVATIAAGIYPDGHWDHATELSTSNADAFVKDNVDAGKTVIAPAWNDVCKKFSSNTDVVFGDVALSKNQVRDIHGTGQDAGSGGWPTLRYFNKQTGYGGAPYVKKTDQAMCDELGPKTEYMQQFVEEIAGVSLCNVNNKDTGCTEQQVKFIEKMSGKSADEIKKQVERLSTMVEKDSGSMNPDALKWAKQRLGIVKQLSPKAEKEEL